MQGKYSNWFKFLSVYIQRQWVRHHVNKLIQWTPEPNDTVRQPGCTAIIGMCSRLEDVLAGNLSCLDAFKWDDLHEVIVVADTCKGNLSEGFENSIQKAFPNLKIRFLFYSEEQAAMTERFRLPYIYSWLSWSIGIDSCQTDTVLLQDYDALILSDTLKKRYYQFRADEAAIQGIRWYKVNGFTEEDKLATTFEAFVDVNWIKSFPPVTMFNQTGFLNGRTVDFDTTLEAQARYTPVGKRTVMDMGEDDLVHPSQMIHQYTMFRKNPAGDMASFSMAMIPFFQFLSGNEAALSNAAEQVKTSSRNSMDLLSDGTIMNFNRLTAENIDWNLKQMLQVCIQREIPPFHELTEFIQRLYEICEVAPDEQFSNGLTKDQRNWIDEAIKL